MSYREGGLDWHRYSTYETIPEYGPGAIRPTNGLVFSLKPFLDENAKVAQLAYGIRVKPENTLLASDIFAAHGMSELEAREYVKKELDL